MRCDGEQPVCNRCRRSREDCQYQQRAPTSHLERANARIERLEHQLAEARSTRSPVSCHSNVDHGNGQGHSSDDQNDLSPHVGLDERGEVTYHGPTSRFSVGSVYDAQLDHRQDNVMTSPANGSAGNTNADLMAQVWQPLLENKTEVDLGAPPMLVQRLLRINWTWQHPLHNYVYKPCK